MKNKQGGGKYTKCFIDAQTSLLIFPSFLDWSAVPSSSRLLGLLLEGWSLSSSIPSFAPPPTGLSSSTQPCLRLRRFNPRFGSGSHSQFLSSLAMKSDSRLRFLWDIIPKADQGKLHNYPALCIQALLRPKELNRHQTAEWEVDSLFLVKGEDLVTFCSKWCHLERIQLFRYKFDTYHVIPSPLSPALNLSLLHLQEPALQSTPRPSLTL